jgi:DME family drug/metabolite transporter
VRDRQRLIGTLAVIAAASGFGLLGVLSRFSYDAGLTPLSFVAWRASFGLAVILVVVAARSRAGTRLVDLRRLGRDDAVGLAIAIAAAFSLNLAMFVAFDLTAVAIVLLAFYTYPALVAVVAVALGHERLDGLGWTALVLAVGGMVLVVAGGLGDGAVASIDPLGVALGLAAAACQTVFVTISRGRFRSVPSEQAMGWVLLVTAVACSAAVVIGGGDLGLPVRSGQALVLVAIAGIVAAGIPSVLFLAGLRIIGGTRAGILMLIEPLVGVTLAAILLAEGLRPVQILGGMAILGAAVLLQRSAPPGETAEPAGVPVAEGT